MNRVVHFEIAAENPERALTFYKGVFGWQIDKWDGPMDYWTISTGTADEPGINGGLVKRGGPAGTVNSIGVSSVDEYVVKVERAGGKVILPKMAIPTIGWLAYCQDTEGVTFGLFQRDPSAK